MLKKLKKWDISTPYLVKIWDWPKIYKTKSLFTIPNLKLTYLIKKNLIKITLLVLHHFYIVLPNVLSSSSYGLPIISAVILVSIPSSKLKPVLCSNHSKSIKFMSLRTSKPKKCLHNIFSHLSLTHDNCNYHFSSINSNSAR